MRTQLAAGMGILAALLLEHPAAPCTPAPNLDLMTPGWGVLPSSTLMRTQTTATSVYQMLLEPVDRGEPQYLLEESHEGYEHLGFSTWAPLGTLRPGEYTLSALGYAGGVIDSQALIISREAVITQPAKEIWLRYILLDIDDGTEDGGFMCSWQELLVATVGVGLPAASTGGWVAELRERSSNELFGWAELSDVEREFSARYAFSPGTAEVCFTARLLSPDDSTVVTTDLGCDENPFLDGGADDDTSEVDAGGCACDASAEASSRGEWAALLVLGLLWTRARHGSRRGGGTAAASR